MQIQLKKHQLQIGEQKYRDFEDIKYSQYRIKYELKIRSQNLKSQIQYENSQLSLKIKKCP